VGLLRGGWTATARPRPPATFVVDASRLLRFETGHLGAGFLGWAILIAAALPLAIGREWRFGWAIRGWTLAVVSWAITYAGVRGWVPFAMPPLEVTLSGAAVGLAFAVGMGAASIAHDLPGYHFGWRQIATGVAVVALGLATLPLLGDAIGDGSWGLSSTDLDGTLKPVGEKQADQRFDVLWVGRTDVLPVDGWRLDDQLSWAVTPGLVSGLSDVFPGDSSRYEKVRAALHEAGTGQSVRLGRALADQGIRYVLVPAQSGLDAETGLAPPKGAIVEALANQLDLENLDVSSAVTVYQNQAWHGSTRSSSNRNALFVVELLVWFAAVLLLRRWRLEAER
jgi:hypothetical protein